VNLPFSELNFSEHAIDQLNRRHLAGLGTGFLGEFVSLIGVLKRSLGVPSSALVIPFFMVFGGSAMSAGRKLVLGGGFPVCLVHLVSSRQIYGLL
jgi:hypothetical protein